MNNNNKIDDRNESDDMNESNESEDEYIENDNIYILEDCIEDIIWEIKTIAFKHPYKIYYKKTNEHLNQHICLHIYDYITNYWNNMDILSDVSRDNSLIIYLFPTWNLYHKDWISYWKIFVVRHKNILYRYSEKELKLYKLLFSSVHTLKTNLFKSDT